VSVAAGWRHRLARLTFGRHSGRYGAGPRHPCAPPVQRCEGCQRPPGLFNAFQKLPRISTPLPSAMRVPWPRTCTAPAAFAAPRGTSHESGTLAPGFVGSSDPQRVAAARCSLTSRAAAGRRSWRRTARERGPVRRLLFPVAWDHLDQVTPRDFPSRNCTARRFRSVGGAGASVGSDRPVLMRRGAGSLWPACAHEGRRRTRARREADEGA